MSRAGSLSILTDGLLVLIFCMKYVTRLLIDLLSSSMGEKKRDGEKYCIQSNYHPPLNLPDHYRDKLTHLRRSPHGSSESIGQGRRRNCSERDLQVYSIPIAK